MLYYQGHEVCYCRYDTSKEMIKLWHWQVALLLACTRARTHAIQNANSSLTQAARILEVYLGELALWCSHFGTQNSSNTPL
jgi:hypothetical protein